MPAGRRLCKTSSKTNVEQVPAKSAVAARDADNDGIEDKEGDRAGIMTDRLTRKIV